MSTAGNKNENHEFSEGDSSTNTSETQRPPTPLRAAALGNENESLTIGTENTVPTYQPTDELIEDNVQAEDSVSLIDMRPPSQVGSNVSNTSSVLSKIRLQNLTRQAELAAEASVHDAEEALLQREREMEAKRLLSERDAQIQLEDIRRAKEKLHLQKEMNKTIAIENLCTRFETSPSVNDNGSVLTPQITINPNSFLPIDVKSQSQIGNGNVPSTESEKTHSSNFGESGATKNDILMLVKEQRRNQPAHKSHQINLEPFDGDPANYHDFVTTFENVYGKDDDPSMLLQFLLQNVNNKVRRQIKAYKFGNPAEGYASARKYLDETYGQDVMVMLSCIKAVRDGPKIKNNDYNQLEDFYLSLLECQQTLSRIQRSAELKNSQLLTQLSSRLPDNMIYQWGASADRIMFTDKREVSVEDITDFVKIRLRQMNNPLFGSLNKGRLQKEDTVKPKKYARAFTTQADAPDQSKNPVNKVTSYSTYNTNYKPCILCSESHFLNQCPQFRKMPITDRSKYVKDNKLCFMCLSNSHISDKCTRTKPCLKCTGNHTTLLHRDKSVFTNKNEASGSNEMTGSSSSDQEAVHSTSCNSIGNSKCKTLLPIVPVKITNPFTNNSMNVYALLDSGANMSFCSEYLTKQLQVKTSQTKLNLSTLTKSEEPIETHIARNLIISDIYDNTSYNAPTLFTRSKLPVNESSIPRQKDIEKWDYLRYVNLPDLNTKYVDVILGNDMPDLLQPTEVIPSEDGGPFAIKTKLGCWAINGPSSHKLAKETGHSFFVQTQTNLMCKVCSDIIYDTQNDKPELSIEHKRFMENAEKTIKLNNGHYSVDLPLKNKNLVMPNNKFMALQRMDYLKKRFSRDKILHDEYTKCIQEMIDSGYVERTTESEALIAEQNSRMWYLPHSAVRHPRKPGRVRVVHDCSAQFQGTSLNSVLLGGPDLTGSIIGVLSRFRQENVAIMADISKMFFQIHVPEIDRCLLSFLWWPLGDTSKPLESYRMVSYPFGAISSPSTANFSLHQTAADFEDKYSHLARQCLQRSMYVDDLLKSVPSIKIAIELQNELRNLLNETGFKLTKWISNDPQVLAAIPESERAIDIDSLDVNFCEKDSDVKAALGVKWNVKNDTLGFSSNVAVKPYTRRGILSVLNSVFDPLGLTIPVLLPIKILLRKLCALGLNWDDAIPNEYKTIWQNWLNDLKQIDNFQIYRSFKPKDFDKVKSYQLHHFCDSSENAMAAVSYIKLVNHNGAMHCALLFARSKLTPTKQVSMPRLELIAATLAIKNDLLLRKELDCEFLPSVFWSDSTTVLFYLRNVSTSFRTFVFNRVEYINNNSDNSQWRYVNTKINISDVATRGMKFDKFLQNNEWINGPKFLVGDNENWPKQPNYLEIHDELQNDVEFKPAVSNFIEITNATPSCLDNLLNKFSDWNKLKKITAWILRYKQILKQRIKNKSNNQQLKKSKAIPINCDEMECAELEIVKQLQNQSYSSEIAALSHGQKIKQTSSLLKLQPVLIDGILRVGGRLDKAPEMSFDNKHPILLGNKSHVASLIVKHFHNLCAHSGREHTTSLIRQKYWIVGSSTLVRKCLRECVECRKNFRSPETQIMAQLPADRLMANEPPFSHVGLDYYGPFYVKRGRSEVKRYGVIFTCLVSRAVHLEVASDLTTDTFILALRRFIARRGQVKSFRSDNGSNLVGAVNELQKSLNEWNQNKINNYLLNKGLKWYFNAPYASHHGAVWERLIRSVRKVLLSIMGEQKLDDESLITFMCEVESVINSRPLTGVSCDPKDPNPLTPNHLLLLEGNGTPPPGNFAREDLYSRKRWRQVQHLTNVFWKRWQREYVQHLQIRQKWNIEKPNLKIGDVVLISDINLPRNAWNLGKILECFPDDLGRVRKVRVKTQNSIILRPITKLCLLYSENYE